MILELTNDEKKLVASILHEDYLPIILNSIQNKIKQNNAPQFFEDVIDDVDALENLYKTLLGFENIKDLIKKKELVQTEIREFINLILSGLKLAEEKRLGEVKDKIKDALGEKEAIKLFNHILYNEAFPVTVNVNVNEELQQQIRMVDAFLRLKASFVQTNELARETRGYFYNSLNASVSNAVSMVDQAQKNDSNNNNSANNNNNNVPHFNSSNYSHSHFKPAPLPSSVSGFRLSGVLKSSEGNAFEKAVYDENCSGRKSLLTAITLQESYETIFNLIKNDTKVLFQKDIFGNNALHIAMLFKNPDNLKLIKLLTNASNEGVRNFLFVKNNFGLNPGPLSIMYGNNEASSYFMSKYLMAGDDKYPLDIDIPGFSSNRKK